MVREFRRGALWRAVQLDAALHVYRECVGKFGLGDTIEQRGEFRGGFGELLGRVRILVLRWCDARHASRRRGRPTASDAAGGGVLPAVSGEASHT